MRSSNLPKIGQLRAKPASTVAQHGIFALWENDVQGRPGIALNLDRDEGADEVWLEVKRLHQTKALEPKSAVLKPWVELTQGPDAEPKLRSTVEGAALIAAGTHRSALQPPRKPEERDLPAIKPDELLPLAGYEQEAQVRSQFSAYVENLWRPWAEEEKVRRWTIRLYGSSSLSSSSWRAAWSIPAEMAWGCGTGIWASKDGTISYPLVTRTVELTLNAETQAIEIRPRDADPRLEVDWYASTDNAGLAEVEKTAKEFFSKATTTFSPSTAARRPTTAVRRHIPGPARFLLAR